MASPTHSLIDEISGHFLTCQICSESFKRPKTLICLHTFCEECLEIRYAIEEQERPFRFVLSRSLSCPLCFTKTDLPPGGVRRLPNNSVVTHLHDVIRRRKLLSSVQSCDICSVGTSASQKSASSRPAASAKCLECSKLMCQKCVELHRRTKVTKDHCLFDVQVEKDVACKNHSAEEVRFYCEQCQTCICIICTFQDHTGHAIFTLTEGIERYADGVRLLLDVCRQRAKTLSCQVDAICRCEANIKTAEDSIRENAFELIAGVRRRERELTAQLHSIYSGETVKLLAQKDPLRDMLRNINATCDLTDALLRQKSVEFLLVHREVTDKLNSILQCPLKDLPIELSSKNVRFTACAKRAFDQIGSLSVSTPIETLNDDITEQSKTFTQTTADAPGGKLSAEKTNISSKDRNALTLALHFSCDASSGTEAESEFSFASCRSEAAASLTLDSSCCSTKANDLVLVNRAQSSNALRPPSPRGPDGWVPMKQRRKTATQLWDSGTETTAVATDTKYTTTTTIYTVDRSTMTSIHTASDKTTSTDWLVVSRDQETFTTPPFQFNNSVQTETPKRCSKSIQFCPETLNKLTMTKRPIAIERDTNTTPVATYDCEVTARIMGDDKATSTHTIITFSTGVGTDSETNEDNMVQNDFNTRNFLLSLNPKFPQFGIKEDEADDLTYLHSNSDDSKSSQFATASVSPDETLNRIPATIESLEKTTEIDENDSLTTNTWRDSLHSSSSRPSSHSLVSSSAYSSQRVSPLSNSVIEEYGYLIGNSERYCRIDEHLENTSSSELDCLVKLENNETEVNKSPNGSDIIAENLGQKANSETLDRKSEFGTNFIERDESEPNSNCIVTDAAVILSALDEAAAGESSTDDGVVASVPIASAETEEVHRSGAAESAQNELNECEISPDVDTQLIIPTDVTSEMQSDLRGKFEPRSDEISPRDTLHTTDEWSEADNVDRWNIVTNFDDAQFNDDRSFDSDKAQFTSVNDSDNVDIKEGLSMMGCVEVEADYHSAAPDLVTSTLMNADETLVFNEDVSNANPEETSTKSADGDLILNEEADEDTIPDNVNEDMTSLEHESKYQEEYPIKTTSNSISAGATVEDQILACKVNRSPQLMGQSVFPEYVASLSKTLAQLEQLLPEISEVILSLKYSPTHNGLVTLLLDICSLVTTAGAKSRRVRDVLESPKFPLNESRAVEERTPSTKDQFQMTYVDRAVSPIRILTKDIETSTKVSVVTQGTSTNVAHFVDIGVQSKRVSTLDRETSMQRLSVMEKETSTPHIHLLHKNTATDNQTTADKQTTMTTDVAAVYIDATAREVARFSRGTCTPQKLTTVDRASSPVRFSCVDKAVLARKEDALEPIDTFQSVGKIKARRPFVSNARAAKLDCICEGTIEEETEDSVLEVDSVSTALSSYRFKSFRRSMTAVKDVRTPFANRNRISLPILLRPGRSLTSAFSFENLPGEDSKEVLSEDTVEDTLET